jgi:hypothetical protein
MFMHATAPAETALPMLADPPKTPRRFPWRIMIRVGIVALIVWPAWSITRMFLTGNVHEAIPGKLYRGGQLSPRALEALIDQHQIRTVLNVRGCCWPDEWYLGEADLCERRGVNLEDVSFSAVHLPSRHELRALLEVLDRAEYPIFVHCRHGSDRTGVAAMSAELLLDDSNFADAHKQLSLRYGHVPIGKTTMLDRFMKLYADWLTANQREHTPANYRHWILNEYRGGWCDARFEKVEPLFEIPRIRQALQYNVVVRNTSDTPWQFKPLKTAGHHVVFKLINQQQTVVYEGRAGMLEKTVQPGESIQVLVIVPPMISTGYYRLQIDMIEEGHCWFHQTGSELWEQELLIRE